MRMFLVIIKGRMGVRQAKNNVCNTMKMMLLQFKWFNLVHELMDTFSGSLLFLLYFKDRWWESGYFIQIFYGCLHLLHALFPSLNHYSCLAVRAFPAHHIRICMASPPPGSSVLRFLSENELSVSHPYSHFSETFRWLLDILDVWNGKGQS